MALMSQRLEHLPTVHSWPDDLAERGVRCIELFHREWDHHGDLTRDLPLQCRDVDQACMGSDQRFEITRHAG